MRTIDSCYQGRWNDAVSVTTNFKKHFKGSNQLYFNISRQNVGKIAAVYVAATRATTRFCSRGSCNAQRSAARKAIADTPAIARNNDSAASATYVVLNRRTHTEQAGRQYAWRSCSKANTRASTKIVHMRQCAIKPSNATTNKRIPSQAIIVVSADFIVLRAFDLAFGLRRHPVDRNHDDVSRADAVAAFAAPSIAFW